MLIRELEDIARGGEHLPRVLVAEAHASIERTRKMLPVVARPRGPAAKRTRRKTLPSPTSITPCSSGYAIGLHRRRDAAGWEWYNAIGRPWRQLIALHDA